MKTRIDEVTGLEIPIEKRQKEFLVVSDLVVGKHTTTGTAHSTFLSRGKALEYIMKSGNRSNLTIVTI